MVGLRLVIMPEVKQWAQLVLGLVIEVNRGLSDCAKSQKCVEWLREVSSGLGYERSEMDSVIVLRVEVRLNSVTTKSELGLETVGSEKQVKLCKKLCRTSIVWDIRPVTTRSEQWAQRLQEVGAGYAVGRIASVCVHKKLCQKEGSLKLIFFICFMSRFLTSMILNY